MPFEDELGEALRRTGDGFTTDRNALVDGGERRGRRLVARRRAAVVGGSVLALAAIGTAGVYSDSLLGGAAPVGVAAPPALETSPPARSDNPKIPGTGTGAVTAEQLIGVLRGLLPAGGLTDARARGTDQPPVVSGVFDDGNGKAAISVGLARVDPKGSVAREATQCGDKSFQGYDDCRTEKLADGSTLLLSKGYEYPDRRVDTKLWRAVLVTPQGFQVDVSEWNAPAEKGAAVSRTNPPLTTAQLKALVTSDRWHPALNDLPAVAPGAQDPPADTGVQVGSVLQSLLPKDGVTVVSDGGQGEYAYAVLDDGKGASLVQVNVQPHMAETLAGLMSGADVTTLPDGTKVKAEQKPGEKGGVGVVWWSVDTLRPDGLRVVVSAFNTGSQNEAATRKAPLLTMDRLKEIALSPKWITP
ncbi:hypothetical protein ACFWBN_04305 [Streptomyces sp. NPDC059989]|uniref:hypothetical protein n=1 Tax=Streptomyces sp. NPDC059989 TaxID=3347026 RepID=UPI0036BDE9DD